jgi:hypothetical protein
LALGPVLEHDCAGLSVVVNDEVEAPIQRECLSVWAVELRHCQATYNVSWIIRHSNDVVELDVLGQEVEEMRPVGDLSQCLLDDAEERIEGLKVAEICGGSGGDRR